MSLFSNTCRRHFLKDGLLLKRKRPRTSLSVHMAMFVAKVTNLCTRARTKLTSLTRELSTYSTGQFMEASPHWKTHGLLQSRQFRKVAQSARSCMTNTVLKEKKIRHVRTGFGQISSCDTEVGGEAPYQSAPRRSFSIATSEFSWNIVP